MEGRSSVPCEIGSLIKRGVGDWLINVGRLTRRDTFDIYVREPALQ